VNPPSAADRRVLIVAALEAAQPSRSLVLAGTNTATDKGWQSDPF
jgi:hypothetical protein